VYSDVYSLFERSHTTDRRDGRARASPRGPPVGSRGAGTTGFHLFMRVETDRVHARRATSGCTSRARRRAHAMQIILPPAAPAPPRTARRSSSQGGAVRTGARGRVGEDHTVDQTCGRIAPGRVSIAHLTSLRAHSRTANTRRRSSNMLCACVAHAIPVSPVQVAHLSLNCMHFELIGNS
jgi:hypothetical protein